MFRSLEVSAGVTLILMGLVCIGDVRSLTLPRIYTWVEAQCMLTGGESSYSSWHSSGLCEVL